MFCLTVLDTVKASMFERLRLPVSRRSVPSMRTYITGAVLAVTLTGCAGSSGPTTEPTPDPAVAVVVDRYGDCITAIGDRLDGEVLPESTGERTYVGFHGPHAVVFAVTHRGGKVYVTPDDPESQRRVAKGGPTC